MVKAPWLPKLGHPAIPEETHEVVGPQIVTGVLQGLAAGEWESSDSSNRLLPDFDFTQPEEFLTAAWTAIDAGAESVSLRTTRLDIVDREAELCPTCSWY